MEAMVDRDSLGWDMKQFWAGSACTWWEMKAVVAAKYQATANKTGSKSKTIRKKKSGVTGVCCAGYGEVKEDSTEPFIGCSVCKTWYQVSCDGMLGKPHKIQASFVCKDCKWVCSKG